MSNKLIEESSHQLRPGLDNAGNATYLNASIQALFACEEFRVAVIVYGLAKPDLDYHKCMADLFINLAIGAEPFYSATQLRDMIASRDPRFQVDGEKDPFDFIWILLDILHENRRSDASYESGTPVITDVFSGRYIRNMKCSENHCWPLPQSANILSLLVRPKVKEAIPLQHLIDSMGTLEVPIDNQKCPQCQRTDTTASLSFDCTAIFLILHLVDMESGSVIIQDTITVLEEQFSIVACICRHKMNDATYYYSCYTKIGQTWYLFRDRNVLIVTTVVMPKRIHLRNAYLLFYRKASVALRYDQIDEVLRRMRDKQPKPMPPPHTPSEKHTDLIHATLGSRAIGLKNLGNTCYMNATLQALFHCEAFRLQILFGQHSGRFHGLLKQLFQEIPFTTNAYVAPNQFWNSFTSEKPSFVRGKQHDTEEFFTAIVELLQTEVDSATTAPQPAVGAPQTPEQHWQHFLESKNNSYIAHTFAFQIENRIVCPKCNFSSIFYENSFICNLEFFDHQVQNPIGVQTCINNAESLPSEFYKRCSSCNQLKLNRFSKMCRTPRVLVIRLNLTSFDPITQTLGKLDLNLTVNDYVDVNKEKFSCFACVLHHGSSSSEGHYTALCKRGSDWYWFDDHRVTLDSTAKRMPDKKLLKESFLLFYEKMSAKSELMDRSAVYDIDFSGVKRTCTR